MRKYIITIFIFCVFTTYAQHQLTGVVKDSADGLPVPYSTVALMQADSSVIKGVMVDDNGKFIIDKIINGDYLLQFSFVGYKKVYRSVNVPKESDIGDIFLSEDVNVLNEVVVTDRRALIVQKLDRIVVNVSGNIISSGLNINDLLKQLPGLIVDEKGTVTLNGKPATVYIDGKPTRLPTEQVAQMLKGMMGDVVDRVELIDNPSSRYEAGLSTAIVNIRIKRDASLGLNGTLQTGIGFSEHDIVYQGGLNINYRSKKINIYGNYGYTRMPEYMDLYQTRSYGGEKPITYDQHSLVSGFSPNHTLRAGIDWFVSEKQTIGFLFNGSINNSDGDIAAKADITQTGISKIDSTEISDSELIDKYNSQMYNLHYQFAVSENEELTADADYGRVYHRSLQNMKSRFLDDEGKTLRSPTEFQYSGPRSIDILSLKVDYMKLFSDKSNLEAGFKIGQTVTDNVILYENLYDGLWEADHNYSNSFKYTEHVSAVYTTYSHQFGKFSAMAGLRAEYTSTKGESLSMDTIFTRGYLDWFPSAYIQYKINDKQGLNISYSRKINRPGYSLLNPFRTYYDPFTYQSGNPDLNPSYRNTIALSYNNSGYFANLSYSVTDDVFQQDWIQDDESHTISLIQKNLGKREGYTLGISAPVPITKWYTLRVYTEATYAIVDTRHSGEQFKNEYLAAYVGLQHAFTILPTLRANLQMTWLRMPWSGILQLNDQLSMNGQIEKTFFDKKISLTLSCNDIFSSLVTRGNINFGNINQTFKEDQHSCQMILTARYNFGSQQIHGARNRSVGIENEIGRTK